jgi:AcrR family transcriptional regulator
VSSRVDGRAARGQETKLRILEAARDTLLERGFGGTSTRAVAEQAGVPLSLVHYHFGDKRSLLVEVLEHENGLLLQRQRALYAAPGPLGAKWRTACEFLDTDVRSGYVRVLWELWAAGLADETLAARWRTAMGGWRDLLTVVFDEWSAGLPQPPPLPARVIAQLVTNVFQGVEIELLAGVTEDEAPHRAVLDSLGRLIEEAEARAR